MAERDASEAGRGAGAAGTPSGRSVGPSATACLLPGASPAWPPAGQEPSVSCLPAAVLAHSLVLADSSVQEASSAFLGALTAIFLAAGDSPKLLRG